MYRTINLNEHGKYYANQRKFGENPTMAIKTLLTQTSIVGPGTAVNFNGADNVRTIQFNPQIGQGFTGSVVIEGSFAANPGANDFQALASVTFTAHMTAFSLDIQNSAPWIRARIATSTAGAISVYGDSRSGSISGSVGATPATAYVESSQKVLGTGTGFKINSPVVPAITSDDVFYANDITKTITDVLNGTNGATGKQDKIGNGVITASDTDLNTLAGAASAGLVPADITKLAAINASAAEINHLIGATSPIQTQLNSLNSLKANVSAVPSVNPAWVNSFFNVSPTITVGALQTALVGLTATATELNILDGATVTTAELNILDGVTATASEINVLDGFTGVTADLNRIVGLTVLPHDLNPLAGLDATGVTATELGYLSGLSENVQAALNTIPSLGGLTASVGDLNLLAGAFSGTGAYASAITANELSFLSGVSSSIQAQLNAKRSTSVQIGWGEIAGVGVSLTELNRLQGVTSNIQSQINALTFSGTYSTGTFSGPAFFANGSAAAPGAAFAGANTSGLYLFGGTGIGMTIAGTRFMTLDGSTMALGTSLVNGAPTMRGSGMAVTDPAYTFTGDLDTGMYWISANRFGLSAAGELLFEINNSGANGIINIGTAADNTAVNIPGKFAGEKVLGVATVQAGEDPAVPFGNGNEVTIYTVPTGRSCIVTRAYVRLVAVTQGTGGGNRSIFRMNLGNVASPSCNELVDNTANTTVFNPGAYAFNTTGQVMPLGVGDNTFPAISGASGASYAAFGAGTALGAKVTALADFGIWNMQVILFGYEF